MFDNPLKKVDKKKNKLFNLNNIIVIAEGAQGFEGNTTLAKLLIRSASLAKANLIKFQLIYADEILRSDHHHYKIFKSLEMNFQDWLAIKTESKKYNIELCLDIFGKKSLRTAKKLKVNYVKIHSSDFFNYELIDESIKKFKYIFISIGGATENEIKFLISKYLENKEKIIFLYGFQSEPTAINKCNINKIFTLKKIFPENNFGFMDHLSNELSESLWLSSLCLANDINIFEKHITLDNTLEIEDHISGLQPVKFKEYVDNLKIAKKFLGNANLTLSKEEKDYRQKAFKVLVAKIDIPKNTKITTKNTKFLRMPINYKGNKIFYFNDDIANKKVSKLIKKNDPITLSILK